jgi:hypothetical protein
MHCLSNGQEPSITISEFQFCFNVSFTISAYRCLGPALRSVGGSRYYVSFIDDFSKFSWIYMINYKSDVYHVFLEFQAHVEHLLDAKILTIQSDWGGEYQHLNTYLQSIGIHHRVSCPHTHQQNGVAERKHHHIVETGVALLAHSPVPLQFWDDTVVDSFIGKVYQRKKPVRDRVPT